MPELINPSLEKAFFSFILQNPQYFDKIEPEFFKNDAIQFIFKIVQEEYINSKIKYVPELKQIATMVRNADPEYTISNEIITSILKNDTSDYNNEYLEQKFKAWRFAKITRKNVNIAVDIIRSLNDIDYDNTVGAIENLKELFGTMTIHDESDEELVADFDDPEVHKQDLAVNKISTGYKTLDILMGGGWDVGTFNVLMGETSVGKCVGYDTLIKIRNKKTHEEKVISIGDFYNNIKKMTF